MLNAEFSYDREDMHIVNLRTGRRVAPQHETERQRDAAEHARDEAVRQLASERRAYEARIAELEAKSRARGAHTD